MSGSVSYGENIAHAFLALAAIVLGLLCLVVVARNRRELKIHDVWYRTLGSFEIAIVMLMAYSFYHAFREVMGWVSEGWKLPEYFFVLLSYIFLARSSARTGETVKYLGAIHDRLTELSITDELTGLYNRRYFFHALEEEIKRAQRYKLPLSLVMADIDHFKKVNDTYGHLVGDQVLRKIAQLMGDSFRKTDIVARYGGEELVSIATVTPLEGATVLAERFREKVFNYPFATDDEGSCFQVAISLGVTSLGDPFQGEKELLIKADKAMYEAKAQGGNKVCVAV